MPAGRTEKEFRKKRREEQGTGVPMQSGGTSGDLTIDDYVPKTPTVAYDPPAPSVGTTPTEPLLNRSEDTKSQILSDLLSSAIPSIGEEDPFKGYSMIALGQDKRKEELFQAAKELRESKEPNIEGLPSEDQERFAEALSKYSGLPPKLTGDWALREGGGWGSDGVSGGEAGEQNWLGIGYPGEQTDMSRSSYFNGVSPEEAGKNAARWIRGEIGGEYSYKAAPSIQAIDDLVKQGASDQEIRDYIAGPSMWGTGEIPNSPQVRVIPGTPTPQARQDLREAKARARNLGLNPDELLQAARERNQSRGPLEANQVPGVPEGMKRLPSAVWFGHKAQNKFGLDVRENEAFDPVDPVHTEGSYHYQTDNKGRGEAIDVSGDPADMLAFDEWVAENYPGVTELFYDPGISLDGGQPSGPIGGHSDHVHVSAVPGTLFDMDSGSISSTPSSSGGSYVPSSGSAPIVPSSGATAAPEPNSEELTTAAQERMGELPAGNQNDIIESVMSLLSSPVPSVDDPSKLLEDEDELFKLALMGRQ